ncbi:LysR family transcriptional regulator [Streptosporangium sp. NPDC049046]|uniref:LysR family transcriptional regulator n=1 Tax=Streptosporangium sp. NPDC049046 TaxID=3155031 RepID=UPI003414CF2C
MLDVRRLRLLRDLARLGTIAAVAQVHTYTPSAVSQQLAALQREAGVALLERTGRRVTLTPAGVALVEHTETVLAELEAASATLAAARSGLIGTMRIGAFPTAVHTLLPAALVALGRDHPGLALMVTELDPAAAPDALRERHLDVALLHDYDLAPVEPDPTLDSTPLLEETVFLAVPCGAALETTSRPDETILPGLPGAAETTALTDPVGAWRSACSAGATAGAHSADTEGAVAAADPVGGFRDADWVVASPGTLCHTVAVRACQAAGFAPRVRHHVDDFTAVLTLVAAGQGVALVPQLGAGRLPDGVRLLPLRARRRTRIAYRRGAAEHPAVAACVRAIRAATEDHLGKARIGGRTEAPGVA